MSGNSINLMVSVLKTISGESCVKNHIQRTTFYFQRSSGGRVMLFLCPHIHQPSRRAGVPRFTENWMSDGIWSIAKCNVIEIIQFVSGQKSWTLSGHEIFDFYTRSVPVFFVPGGGGLHLWRTLAKWHPQPCGLSNWSPALWAPYMMPSPVG